MKLFEFDDFMLHYQNVHLQGNVHDSDSDKDGELEACIKDEEFENVEYLAELDECGVSPECEVKPVRILSEATTTQKKIVSPKSEIGEVGDVNNLKEYDIAEDAGTMSSDEFDDDFDVNNGNDDVILKKVSTRLVVW